MVPAGTCTWSTSINVNKSVTFAGAGMSSTLITGPIETPCFALDFAKTTRITGFGFTNCTVAGSSVAVAGQSFRIDHNSFTAGSWDQSTFDGSCSTPQVHPTGLVDHNTIKNYRMIVASTNCIQTDGNEEDQEWAKQPPLGNSGTQVNGVMQEAVYFEDNTFTNTLPTGTVVNWVDGNLAGRYVLRFNTINGNALNFVEVHSEAGFGRAVQRWELYKNTINVTGSWFTGAYIRGGSGVMWGNTYPDGVFGQDIKINNVRSCNDPGGGQGKCDGTQARDQNTSGQSGYSCRDQIGRSYDTTLWSYPSGAYAQSLTPAYFWSNTHTPSGSQFAVVVDAGETCSGTGDDLNATHIQANRDYYANNASFNGTTGVGMGVLAARPATCTPGTAYWATDQGEWNSNSSGPDGELFKCTSSNVWSVYYVPFTYPYPLNAKGLPGM